MVYFKFEGITARWIIIGFATLIVVCWGHPAPDPNNGISDALKYLHELDKIYAHVAMPSEMSPEVQDAIASMKELHHLDKLYSNRIRPRFGKRTEVKNSITDYDDISEDDVKNLLTLLKGR